MSEQEISSKTLKIINKKSKELNKKKRDERERFKRQIKKLERKDKELERAKKKAKQLKQYEETKFAEELKLAEQGQLPIDNELSELVLTNSENQINTPLFSTKDQLNKEIKRLSTKNDIKQPLTIPTPNNLSSDTVLVVDQPKALPKEQIIIKKALLIGINYIGTVNQLNGCINDTQNLSDLLTMRNYFKPHEIIFMTDNHIGTPLYPTKANILTQMESLLNIALKNPQAKIQLFICYSGHGGSIKDKNSDEIDGKDEVLCPIDFATSGYIIDDDLNAKFAAKFHSNVEAIFLIDACHSGTILDLRYNPSVDSKDTMVTYNNYPIMDANIVTISGCRDNQTSADTNLPDQKTKIIESQGAMTAAFITCYKRDSTYKNIINNMRTWLKQKKYMQIPQLSSSKPILTNSLFMLSNFASIVA